jgi:threonine dehydrogenase-like Zn-dependent dehydrogenase
MRAKTYEYPRNTGYISVGRIIDAGEGVDPNVVGKRVVTGTGHLAYLTRPYSPADLTPIPDGLPLEHAVFAQLATISIRAVRNARVQIGDSFLVTGMGLIGQFAQIFARLNGAHPVVGLDLSERRLDIARKTGLRYALNAGAPDINKQLSDIVPGGRFMTTVDSTGTPNVISSLPAKTAKFGKIVVLGGVHKTVDMDMYSDVQKQTQTIFGAGEADPRDYPYDERRNREVILQLMADKLIDVSPLLTHHVPVDQAPEMYRMLHEEKDKGMGVVFKWD